MCPYRPLLEFNPRAPNVGVERHSAAVSWLLDMLADSDSRVRAGLFGFLQDTVDDRFSVGPDVVSTDRFDGLREPLHQDSVRIGGMSAVEMTWRVFGLAASHMLRPAVSATRVERTRVERGLHAAERAPEGHDELRPLES